MLILSPFTDYYDYLSTQDDDKFVYNRDLLTAPGIGIKSDGNNNENQKLVSSVHGLELQVPLSYLDWLPANFSAFSDYNLNAAGTGIDYKFC